MLAGSLAAVVINTWYTRRLLAYGVLAQLRDQAGTLALSALAAVAGWLALRWLAPGAPALVAAIVLAAVVYLGGAVLVRHPALADLSGFLRALRQPAPPAPEGADP